MTKIERDMKEVEHIYYERLEWVRVFGAEIDRLEKELSDQLGVKINFMFLYPDKKLMHTIFGSDLSATEVYSALEMMTDDLKTEKNSENNEVKFSAKIRGFDVRLDLMLANNQRCWYEEVGTKEVPVYELRCEES